VETKAKIKRLHGREGKSIRCMARELKLSRNTVRKAVREGMDEGLRYVRKNQPLPQLGGHVKTPGTGWRPRASCRGDAAGRRRGFMRTCAGKVTAEPTTACSGS
jgi:hypothetical protein